MMPARKGFNFCRTKSLVYAVLLLLKGFADFHSEHEQMRLNQSIRPVFTHSGLEELEFYTPSWRHVSSIVCT